MNSIKIFIYVITILLLYTSNSVAQSTSQGRCLNLTERQANQAVAIIKRSTMQGMPLMVLSKKETGWIIPLSLWSEKKNGDNPFYQIRIDNRLVDISLIYLRLNREQRVAHNLAGLVGCRPAIDRPLHIRID